MKELAKSLSNINIYEVVKSKGIHGKNRGDVYKSFFTILDGDDFGMEKDEAVECLKVYGII